MSKALTSKTKQKTKDETVSEKKETVFIYVGPTNKYIARYTIYRNGYPTHLKEQIEEFPLLKSLFIIPEQLNDFEKKVNEIGSVENIWFQEAQKYFGKAVS